MFSLFGIAASLLLAFLSPRFLPVGLAAAAFGWAIDLRLRWLRPELTPQLPWALALFAWAALGGHTALLVTPLCLYFLVAHGIQSLRALRFVGALLLLAALGLSAVAVEQRAAPLGCFQSDESGVV